ncbi:MAG: hypothetical protein AAF282_02820 [Cyanobacteria bacterium P01_A01_bin.15]
MARRRGWPVSKPGGLPTGFRVERLTTIFKRLEVKQQRSNRGIRLGIELGQPAQLLIQLSSTIAQTNGWYRAGFLAQIMRGAPIPDPIQSVHRVYFDEQHILLPWQGLSFYLEVWPHIWITDYRLELWGRIAPVASTAVTIPNEPRLVLFGTEANTAQSLTVLGVSILFP